MTMVTRRTALSLRRLSTPSSSKGSENIASSDLLSSQPWLDRLYKVWYEESGMREIYHLKEKVDHSSVNFDKKQRQVAEARSELSTALKAWEESQGQHTKLLQSRDNWTPEQAQEFASLVQAEVTVRNDLEEAKKNLAKRESQQANAQMEYMNDLRKRYHEEQIWQDKWRVLSTFGTWGLIVLNTIVFLVSQYMSRLRETQRLKDIQVLLEESLSKNSSTLEEMKEQQQQHQKHQNQLLMQRTTTNPNAPVQEIPEQAEDSHEGIDSSQTAEEESKFESLEEDEPTSAEANGLIVRIKNNITEASSWKETVEIVCSETSSSIRARTRDVDLTSAVLGASVTAVAWAASVALASRRSGQ